ncbi:hypothetical protein IQ264_02010 [Phormidium sp. LEGE 05292]|uniref:hypothetical protein n=1 Tax=[Phormidium] sp. LEGE 05292 TaxID=767427 RepID=UPI001880D8B5|nr:hypothetical protein [Phormidium sp. LEGE 05292]MBE9224246.1 hypothetical protein [Phormidium sp. LEGE 05292]
MSLNKFIAGVAIAGLAVLTATPTVPSFAGEKVSSQTQTQQFAQRGRDWDRDRDDRWRDRSSRRVCYYERRGRRTFYCCRERFWNGRYYDVRTSCQPVRR